VNQEIEKNFEKGSEDVITSIVYGEIWRLKFPPSCIMLEHKAGEKYNKLMIRLSG
jgi:hypothetical protein